ncbi:hypothetical protein ACLOJK_022162 [Asimina triloba]
MLDGKQWYNHLYDTHSTFNCFSLSRHMARFSLRFENPTVSHFPGSPSPSVEAGVILSAALEDAAVAPSPSRLPPSKLFIGYEKDWILQIPSFSFSGVLLFAEEADEDLPHSMESGLHDDSSAQMREQHGKETEGTESV